VAYTDDPADRALLVAAAYVILQDDADRVLLQLRRGTGYMDEHWAVLAGHLEPGETIVAAAVREAAEESGVVVDPGDLEPLTTLHRFIPGGPQIEQRCDWFFRARRWTGEPTRLEPHRCADMRWFALDALPEPVVPHELTVLRHLAHGTTPPAILAVPHGA
jgi:8-oxo-dGTP pyrophosphatase MutT (NUDIX family)